MQNYIQLAVKSDWLPHYYNTLYLFISGANNKKKQHQVFENIIDVISKGDKGQNFRLINRFIENGQKWAHIDISGIRLDKTGLASGFGVRLLNEFIKGL